jgi:hypothetical protein
MQGFLRPIVEEKSFSNHQTLASFWFRPSHFKTGYLRPSNFKNRL